MPSGRKVVGATVAFLAGAAAMAAAGSLISTGSDNAERLDECRMAFAVGATVSDPADGCVGPDGVRVVYGTAPIGCPGGRTLTYNNLAVWNADGLVVAEFVKGFGAAEVVRWCEAAG